MCKNFNELFGCCNSRSFASSESLVLAFFIIQPWFVTDLRDDKQFFIDHPGAVPITTVQVGILLLPQFYK